MFWGRLLVLKVPVHGIDSLPALSSELPGIVHTPSLLLRRAGFLGLIWLGQSYPRLYISE